jgi:hypothetical protein
MRDLVCDHGHIEGRTDPARRESGGPAWPADAAHAARLYTVVPSRYSRAGRELGPVPASGFLPPKVKIHGFLASARPQWLGKD